MSYGKDSDLYSKAAKLYADPSIRPVYPPELYQRIFSFIGSERGVALDVATGSGQCARELAKEFQQVYAIDASEEQVKQCKPQPRVQYQVACAEQTGRPENSVDLVTVATALHWFDIQNFYKEVRRVLKPHGTLAAWCYMVPQVKDSAAASAAVNRFFFQTLKPYIEEPHKRFLEQYRTIEPQDTDFCEVKRDTLDFEQRSSIRLLIGFAKTTGFLANMRKKDPKRADPVPAFQEDLLKIMGTTDLDCLITLNWHTIILLAKEPVPLKG